MPSLPENNRDITDDDLMVFQSHSGLTSIEISGSITESIPNETPTTFECPRCFQKCFIGTGQEVDGVSWCPDCVSNYAKLCDNCEEYTIEVTRAYYRNSSSHFVCNSCLSADYEQCTRCDNFVVNDHIENDYCDNCMEELDDEQNERVGFETRDVCETLVIGENTAEGKIITSPRMFGVEIECQYNDSDDVDTVYNEIESLGISEDGSVSGKGVEFQTPKLQNSGGEKYIIELCDLLNKKEFKVDSSCGLHVHLSAEDIQNSRLQTAWLFYAVFDNVILSFLPSSRRQNRFCAPISKLYPVSKIMKSYNQETLEYMWYDISEDQSNSIRRLTLCKQDHKHDTRYCGINLHTLIAEGHIEIRYHSGTISKNKILYWVALHQKILDSIMNGRIDFDHIVESDPILSIVEKTKKFFEVLQLPDDIQKYFIDRQQKFNGFRENTLESTLISQNEKDLCAE